MVVVSGVFNTLFYRFHFSTIILERFLPWREAEGKRALFGKLKTLPMMHRGAVI